VPPHVPSVETLAVDVAAVLVFVVLAALVEDVFMEVLTALLEDTPPTVQVPKEAWQAVLQ